MSEPAIPISVADAKRRFSDLLGAVRYQHARYVIERNGTPMAAIVPLDDLEGKARTDQRQGLLALVGAFADSEEYADSLDDAVRSRSGQRSRRVPPIES